MKEHIKRLIIEDENTEMGRKAFIPIYMLLALVVCSSLVFFYRIVTHGSYFADYREFYYPEGQLFWNRIDPSTVGGTAFPWSYVLQSLYVVPFFPLKVNVVWGTMVYIIVTCILVYICGKQLKDRFLAGAIICSMFALWFGFSYGNYGAMCCIFAIFSIYLAPKNKLISGICLALALMKPHATALIVFPFLLCGYIEVDIIAGVCICVATAFSGIYVGEYPWNMMLRLLSFGGQSAENGVTPRLGDMTSGITDFLLVFGCNKHIVYFTSVMVAVIYCGVLLVVLYKHNVKSLWEVSFPFAIALSFWFFENPQDEFILFIPLITLVQQLKTKYNGLRCNVIEAFEVLVLGMGSMGCVLVMQEVMETMGFNVSTNLFYIMMSIFHGIVAVIGIMICKEMISNTDRNGKKAIL